MDVYVFGFLINVFRIYWSCIIRFSHTTDECRSVAAVVSCYCFIIVAAVIVLGLGALLLLFVLLYSQRVASHSRETLRQLLHDPDGCCH